MSYGGDNYYSYQDVRQDGERVEDVISQLKKKLISIEALEAQGLKGTLRYGVLKMLKGSMILLKSVR